MVLFVRLVFFYYFSNSTQLASYVSIEDKTK